MSELTTQILIEIRDGVLQLGDRLDGRIDELGNRLGETNTRLERVERRQVETEVRLATELMAVVAAVNEVRDVLIEDRKLRATVDDHERRLRRLEKRRSS